MMNAKKIERWILLEQTGELSPRRKAQLDACPEAQALRDELQALQRAIPPVEVQPSPWATSRIQARLKTESRTVLLPARAWQPILALAACLTVAVMWFTVRPGSSPETRTSSVPSAVAAYSVEDVDAWDMEFEEDLEELEVMILDISDTSMFELAGL